MHVRGVPRTVLDQSHVPGRGPDLLNRCEVAAESSLLTRSPFGQPHFLDNTIGGLLPCGCTSIAFWKNGHSYDVEQVFLLHSRTYGWKVAGLSCPRNLLRSEHVRHLRLNPSPQVFPTSVEPHFARANAVLQTRDVRQSDYYCRTKQGWNSQLCAVL